jgi:hypothetical protein
MLGLLLHHHRTLIAWVLNTVLLLVFLLLFLLSAEIGLRLQHHILIAKYLLLSTTVEVLELLLGLLLLEFLC